MMRLPVFFTAPHRVMFLSGVVQALLAMAFWSMQLGGQYAGLWPALGWPLLDVVPASALHALLICYGVLPFFIFGFILTAGPRWQGLGDVQRRAFLPASGLLACGWFLVWTALLLPQLLTAGLTLGLLGWISIAVTLTRIARNRAAGREHMVFVASAAWLGAAGQGAFLVFAAGGAMIWVRLSIALAVWGFLLPVFLAVTHRMLPFFTSSVVPRYALHRPAWALRALLGLSLVHGAMTFLEQGQWLWLADVPAMIIAGRLSWLWWSGAAMANRMLAVLHVSFAWLAPAFGLFALQSALQGSMPGILGQAPLHALTLGFFAAMLLGMASRVSLGHSGRPVAADDVMWWAFCMTQTAAVLRVVSDLPGLPGAPTLMWLSAMLWLGALAIWSWRYAPSCWRPRVDGKPG